ncbi:MAG: hypothetical protein R3B48_01720 [Kofleriaceae bacterium]
MILALGAGAGAARADSSAEVTVILNPEGERLAQELGLDTEAFRTQAADKIASALQVAEVQRFLRSFANATSFSNRGVGADYASNAEGWVFGFAANLALSVDLGGGAEIPTVGFAPAFALMGGLNLSRWRHPEISLFANAFHSSGDSGQLRGGITNLGLHAQYKLFTPTRGKKRYVIQWGGLDFTTGVELARWSFGLHQELEASFDLAGVGAEASLDAGVSGRFDVGATTVTLPVEVSTNVRFLYVLSGYLGLGLDAQLGRASVGAGVEGHLRGALPGEMEQTVAEVSVSAQGRNRPSAVGYHLLLGLQANLWRVKLFTQVNLQPSTELNVALALGARLVL